MRRRSLLIPALLAAAIFATSTPSDAAPRRRLVSPRPTSVLTIGALFSLTGDGASLGLASAAALELAARDIDTELRELALPYRITFSIEDTQLMSSLAVEKLEVLLGRGATIILGPQSSSEAAAIREAATEAGVIVISQGSTASSLAIAGDNLFRFAPNDRLEGAAMAALLREDGIETLIPFWRADVGNTGLHDSTKLYFEALGGTVAEGVSYDPATTDFTSQVSLIGAAVREARMQSPASEIAIYLASFEEAVAIFELARLDSDLDSIRWYGGDGVTQSQAIIDDPDASDFAAEVGFTAPNVGLDESTRERWEPIRDEIESMVGFAPDAFALSVYDAAWVGTLSALEVQLRADRLRPSFVRNVERYLGLTGSTSLDANGDRRTASFDFWTVQQVEGEPRWVRTAQYSGGRISR